MNKMAKELVLKIYDERIAKLEKAKKQFLEDEKYNLITPQEIFNKFCRENPQIGSGNLLEEFKKQCRMN